MFIYLQGFIVYFRIEELYETTENMELPETFSRRVSINFIQHLCRFLSSNYTSNKDNNHFQNSYK